jgi:hypothetical protein
MSLSAIQGKYSGSYMKRFQDALATLFEDHHPYGSYSA